MSPSGRRGRGAGRSDRAGAPRYPRALRVNQLLREVLGDAIGRLAASDERLNLLTITDVECDPDLHAARLLFASLDEDQLAALTEARVRLQGIVGREVRLRRTPLLSFAVDPAIETGNRIEDILRGLDLRPDEEAPDDEGSAQ